MGKFIVELTEKALKDIALHKKSGNKSSEKKIKKILEELKEHPYTGTGQPEALKYQLSGKWSRRINNKDRMIYEVKDKIVTVEVLSAIGHYLDK
ncbi:MAG: Txe/YoeB family addiction module toxin [Brumimicrobium sp.]|nr:Txe/YoeB family addiction module toxin [Brumimicrobium sp.]MCO5268246.1 Txe/YoeB family addiction module toxin [Brumimicrobium sp.]